jgi:hypothetical protein
VAESCKKGSPWNIIRANSYGNFVTVLIIAILGITLSRSINEAGGVGLAYTCLTLLAYLGVFGMLTVSGGICTSALRITQYIKLWVHNTNAEEA